MASQIPEDFGAKWTMSDIVLNTLNSDEKKLHASKHVLATHSAFFEAMFFGAEWKEKSSDCVDLDDEYEAVKEVLRILYHMGLTFKSPEQLFNLYTFADKRDIPMIRDMCKEELAAQPSVESLGVTARLGFHDITAKILDAVDLTTVSSFVDSIVGQGVFCDGEEVKIILAKSKTHYESLLKKEVDKNAELWNNFYSMLSAKETIERRCSYMEPYASAAGVLYKCNECDQKFVNKKFKGCPFCHNKSATSC